MTIDDIQGIKTILLKMHEEDPELRIFGSDFHQYRFGATRSEDELQAFERKHQLVLPPDYRFFLKELGDGGANQSPSPYIPAHAGPGPGYGIFPLEEAIVECDVSRPFPLTEGTDVEAVPGIDQWGDEERYPGVLEIGYYGCGGYVFLVVNGPSYGTVWSGDVDIRNFRLDAVSFEAWFRRWIAQWTDGKIRKSDQPSPFLRMHQKMLEGG